MSLLLSEGHPHAADYPLWQLGLEATIAAERINREAVSSAQYIQTAVSGLLSKDGYKDWKQLVTKVFDHG